MRPLIRIAGLSVHLDFTWIAAFALISWSLTGGAGPRLTPHPSIGGDWRHAMTILALLFVSVLLHEVFQALVAHQNGAGVRGIRLHPIGGEPELDREPPAPGADFLIGAIGPLMSFVLAALAYGLGQLMRDAPGVVVLTGYLFAINLLIGLVNLVPAPPLDGGRMLRAMLWWWSGRRAWATRWALRAGLAFAAVLLVIGLVRLVRGEVIGGLWFALVALVLYRAGRSGAVVPTRPARVRRDVAARAA
ncbi:MAG TPA: site-2 protease family protein [Methylomirabilota bacterium]|jgi:Zn-dependent protease|nr:site-2 protease family protein [Methylomirabilota bacterium]